MAKSLRHEISGYSISLNRNDNYACLAGGPLFEYFCLPYARTADQSVPISQSMIDLTAANFPSRPLRAGPSDDCFSREPRLIGWVPTCRGGRRRKVAVDPCNRPGGYRVQRYASVMML